MTVAGALLLATGVRTAAAQVIEDRTIPERYVHPDAPQADGLGPVLRSLASRAGIVFVGQVESIQPNGGVMEIVFNVQQQVIGEVGDTYTLREWSGRWSGGQERYRKGQRAMVFLYAPNAAGISSPVDGMAGVVPLVPMGADAEPLLDVRWLATRVERHVGEPIVDAETGGVSLSEALTIVAGGEQAPPREPVRRPLPVGLRPHPVKTLVVSPEQADMPSILQQQETPDVEH
jgi:hypothetical protein